MGTCEWSGEGETGLLGIDYVRLYHCEFAEWAILFYPLLFGWGCFLTYLCKSASHSPITQSFRPPS